ncbi:MAG TPA: hypothetical protein DEP84_37775, partial [Chloroflexi bacterium]|nr:hypothetical protein [Chloroflexota bacterium]
MWKVETIVEELLPIAETRGTLTAEDVAERLVEIGSGGNPGLLAAVFERLEEEGVHVIDDETRPTPTVRRAAAEAERMLLDLTVLSPDDTVGLYLMESCHHPLLTAQQETELASGMEAGLEAEARLQRQSDFAEEARIELEKTVRRGQLSRQRLI